MYGLLFFLYIQWKEESHFDIKGNQREKQKYRVH